MTDDDVIKAALMTTIKLNPGFFNLAHKNLEKSFVQQFASSLTLADDGSLEGLGGSLQSELTRAKTDSSFEHYWLAAGPTKQVIDKATVSKMTPEQKLAYANSLVKFK